MKTILLFSLLISSFAWSVTEFELPKAWTSKIEPYFRSMEAGMLTNKEGLSVHYFYKVKSGNKKSLVIAPGRTEPALKYAELIYDLKDSGFDIFIIDHQGQGESSRILKDTQKGHVVNFQNYVTDFDQFMKDIVVPNGKPAYLIAHSMGGAIATRFMSLRQNAFKKAVLVAPMLEMNTSPYSETIARIYAQFLVLTGKGSTYAPGHGPYKPEEDTFEKNVYTHSEARFDMTKNIFVTYPNLVVGGPTARWVHESLKATKSIHKLKMTTEVLMFQAGLDHIVKPARQNSFCTTHKCEQVHIPDAFHEILMERDVIRDDVLHHIRLFFNV